MPDLSQVAEGDKLILHHRRYVGEDDLSIVTVERTTATQIVVDGTKYSRETGKQLSGSWKPPFVELHTPELERKAKCQMLRRLMVLKLNAVRWEDVEPQALLNVVAVLMRDGVLEGVPCTE